MVDKIRRMFSSSEGKHLYERVLSTLNEYDMHSMLKRGALVGFSGGADSVMLVSFLYYYRIALGLDFPIALVHVNHGIRGDEARADAEFSEAFAQSLSLEFILAEVDVPRVAAELGTGIEETARNERYSIFDRIMSGRDEYNTLLLAHNATDNSETVIINMLRGSGVLGMCGIPPVRDCIARPLIEIEKSVITDCLNRFEIPYVTDSTNLSDEYTRNYVRHNILPHFHRLSASPDEMIGRMSRNMRSVYSFISDNAEGVLSSIKDPFCFDADILRSLHPALFASVFTLLVKRVTGYTPTEAHISAVRELISGDSFAVSLVGEYDFESRRGICTFSRKNERVDGAVYPLSAGLNVIDGTNAAVLVGDTEDKTSLNIYNFSIHVMLRRDIIENSLCMRYRRDGDSYKYSGHTRRLKKVFNDKNIPAFLRDCVPVICDAQGIVWVPGLPARDGAALGEELVKVTLLLSSQENAGVKRLICATRFDGVAN